MDGVIFKVFFVKDNYSDVSCVFYVEYNVIFEVIICLLVFSFIRLFIVNIFLFINDWVFIKVWLLYEDF